MSVTEWQGVQACTIVDTVGPNGVPMHGEPADVQDGSKVYTVTPLAPMRGIMIENGRGTHTICLRPTAENGLAQPPHAEGLAQ